MVHSLPSQFPFPLELSHLQSQEENLTGLSSGLGPLPEAARQIPGALGPHSHHTSSREDTQVFGSMQPMQLRTSSSLLLPSCLNNAQNPAQTQTSSSC